MLMVNLGNKVRPIDLNMAETNDSSPDIDRKLRTGSSPKMAHPTDNKSHFHVPENNSALDYCVESFLKLLGHVVFFLLFPLTIWLSLRVAFDYERFVLFRMGRLRGGPRGPGLTFVSPFIDDVQKVDLRTVTFDVPPQEILTKDSVTVAVDAVVYFRVFEPIASVLNVENANTATRLLAQTTLRNLLGTLSLSEILAKREHISSQMQSYLDEATDVWGIKVERVEIKDVRLPKELQRAMAAEAEATREAKAKVIAAQGEHEASRSLQAAAEVIGTAPSAIHLRYLQTLNSISAEKNSTVVFPFPIEMLKK